MRTTLLLEGDVLETARSHAKSLRKPFRRVVNEALRAGLQTVEEPATSRPYHTRPHKMGLRAGMNLDNLPSIS